MENWSDFHSDPRKSYYLFLRQGYGCPAHEAHARVKWVDAMVTSLEMTSPGVGEACSLASRAHLLRAVSACTMALHRVWTSVYRTAATRHGKAPRALRSNFFHST